MRILERARALGFVAWDSVRGSPVERQMAEVERAQHMGPDERLSWQREALAAVLRHARDTAPFYRDLIPRRVDADNAPAVLARLPIVDKHAMKNRLGDFLSSAFRRDALWEGHTNGSTGAPFAFFADRHRRDRVRAETLVFGRWAGYRVGEPHAFLRLLYWHPKSRARLFLENQLVLEPRDLGTTEIDRLLGRVARSKAVALIGYPSVLELLARRRQEAGGPSLSLRSVVSIGEVLLPQHREAIERAFGCPVFERYSATEVGYIAHDCEEHRLHVNVGSLWLELLPPSPDAAEAPTAERRVIVTDLFNYGMPFLRYELADRVVPGEGHCPCGRTSPFLRAVHGRVSDRITLPNGHDIEATGLGGIFVDLPEIRQYQLVQVSQNGYRIILVPEPAFRDATRRKILERTKAILGADAVVEFSLVDHIDPLPGGKRAYLLSDIPREEPS